MAWLSAWLTDQMRQDALPYRDPIFLPTCILDDDVDACMLDLLVADACPAYGFPVRSPHGRFVAHPKEPRTEAEKARALRAKAWHAEHKASIFDAAQAAQAAREKAERKAQRLRDKASDEEYLRWAAEQKREAEERRRREEYRRLHPTAEDLKFEQWKRDWEAKWGMRYPPGR